MRTLNEITQKELKGYLSYDENTGLFTWLNNMGYKTRAGSIAGSTRKDNGRVMIKIHGTNYQAARLAYHLGSSGIPYNTWLCSRSHFGNNKKTGEVK